MAVKGFGTVSVLTIVIGAIGVLVPIAWDYYKTTASIELRVSKTSEIIAEAGNLAGLSILYNGEVVQSLSKTTFKLVNSGRTPIVEKDVVSPVTIRFQEGVGVIEAKIESSMPKDIGASILFDKAKGVVILRFPLMNPMDAIKVSVLSTSPNLQFTHSARVAGIGSISVVKEEEESIKNEKSRWITIPVGAISVLMILAALVGLSQVRAELRVKRKLRNGSYQLPNLQTRQEFIGWIDREFFFTSNKERRALKTLASTLDDLPDFSVVNKEKIMTGVTELVETAIPNLQMAVMVSAIGGLGIFYIW